MLHEDARAKVNLFLHVVGRRTDGYHLLDSVAVFPGAVFPGAADRVYAEPAAQLSLAVRGPFGAGLAADGDNLVLRAARALATAAGVDSGAALVLEKNLPVASGIGGGSADAAAALRVLSRLWGLVLEPAVLAAIAAGLGADVPVCLQSVPMRMGGVGDVLTPAPTMPPCGIALVNPGVAVSTPSVFRARATAFNAHAALPEQWSTAAEMAAALAETGNDLETAALGLAPEIGAVLAWLRGREGCLLARMSGSGATCFALFADPATAARAVAPEMAPAPDGWWRWGGDLPA